MIEIGEIVRIHDELVANWHRGPLAYTHQGILGIICEQHRFNFLLWHEEDIARSPVVSDAEIAGVKRRIDVYNQQRNDWIERIDEALAESLEAAGVTAQPDARLNTETVGSAVDRLSIASLRIFHLAEQLDRTDIDNAHHRRIMDKLATCQDQRAMLAEATHQLIRGIAQGAVIHRLYRQNKMYNDPTLNPFLYNPDGAAAMLALRHSA